MKIAAIQMVSSHDVAENLAQAQGLLEQAAAQGAELAVLPEYFCLLGRKDTDKLQIQEQWIGSGTAETAHLTPESAPIQMFLARTARRLGLWLVGGSLPLTPEGSAAPAPQVRNSTLVFDPAGRCVARYDKMHLFGFDNGRERYDESRALQAGDAPLAFELTARDGQHWRIGVAICYDLRFPELFRRLDAELLLLPASFTHTTGEAHWEVLLRARAIENLAYVAAAAQGGTHSNGRRTWGQSLVIDPWGEVLAQQATGAAVVLAEIRRSRVDDCRRQLPALSHRRL